MKKHVDLLGILYMLCGGLNVVVGVALLALGGGAAAVKPPALLTAAVFLVIAAVALAWGAANLWAGAAIRRHSPTARLLGLAMAVLNLFVLPFGTALGIYSLWVLLNDQSRQLFTPGAA